MSWFVIQWPLSHLVIPLSQIVSRGPCPSLLCRGRCPTLSYRGRCPSLSYRARCPSLSYILTQHQTNIVLTSPLFVILLIVFTWQRCYVGWCTRTINHALLRNESKRIRRRWYSVKLMLALKTSESDVCRSQILMYKDGPHTEGTTIFLMDVDQ